MTIDAIRNISGLVQISLPAYSDHLGAFPERERRCAGAFLPWDASLPGYRSRHKPVCPIPSAKVNPQSKVFGTHPLACSELRVRLDHRSPALTLLASWIGGGEAGQFPLQWQRRAAFSPSSPRPFIHCRASLCSTARCCGHRRHPDTRLASFARRRELRGTIDASRVVISPT